MDIIVTSHKELKNLINEAVNFQLRRFFEENHVDEGNMMFTAKEARERLKISRTTEHELNKKGVLVPVMVGGRKRYTKEAIEKAVVEI